MIPVRYSRAAFVQSSWISEKEFSLYSKRVGCKIFTAWVRCMNALHRLHTREDHFMGTLDVVEAKGSSDYSNN
jgi:hypothetical protein